jgi:aspartate kinase
MFDAMSRERINIEMISTSEIKISCIIRKAQAERAMRAIHRAFALSQAPGSRGRRAASAIA